MHGGVRKTWRIVGGTVPVALTATAGEAARAMAMRVAERLFGSRHLDPCLHGPEGEAPPGRHLHAFYLAQDRDGDGCLDHLTIAAPGGISARSQRILAACEAMVVDGFGRTPLVPLIADPVADAPSRVWVSATPFVGPSFARKAPKRPIRAGLDARTQLIAELARHRDPQGAPLPEVAVVETPAPATGQPWRLGSRHATGEAMRVRGWFTLVFARPVHGPLAFGLAAHFGLGRFVAAPGPDITAQAPGIFQNLSV